MVVAPGTSVVAAQVTTETSLGSTTVTPVSGTLPMLVTTNEYVIVSVASAKPLLLVSLSDAVLTTEIAGRGAHFASQSPKFGSAPL